MVVALGVGVGVGLFVLWSLFLLVRFAIAFAREIRRKWKREDRALAGGP